ncbi:hypothetical protein BABINDRAFT_31139 [Babjeviella inositovora NRRL Y-12698]|uniref:Mitochondrial carrier protein RIM2 n=1 Tax=Babjeviella inositovora NRRL Y-12698 TaxID=984486 RepID=A0A1E3QX60_9ASCO|nr:uncharacterized protein BABINDRAFT_31139 [Babjeviella inositovora NRRL Y-12698]ODQ82181.1 hypothetical protein BABINDRAFT_31139 [Babjeviella inositovora NRRL Y-12698]
MVKLGKLESEAEQSFKFLGSDEKVNLKSVESLQEIDVSPVKITKDNLKQTKPWVHFVAGGIGGMAGAIFTCPLDVVKTRLQSSEYREMYKHQSVKITANSKGIRSTFITNNPLTQAGVHVSETMGIIGNVYKTEGFRALFKGLGPNLVGVIPARSINFFTYGVSKDVLSQYLNGGKESTYIHLLAGISAGIVTSTATNPIWLIKTRLQLDKAKNKAYKNSWDCFTSILKYEGAGALYRGLSASYLGSVESTIQWVLYEQMKSLINERSLKNHQEGKVRTSWDSVMEWSQRSGAAGAAKFFASLITYPHEVVRTRLRQAPPTKDGRPKYTGLMQCFKLVIKEEGFISMYGGLTAHLLRTVPNSIIMFGTWEIVIKLLSDDDSVPLS